MYIPHFKNPFILQWTFRLSPHLGYCKWCHSEHRANISLRSWFQFCWIIPRSGIFRSFLITFSSPNSSISPSVEWASKVLDARICFIKEPQILTVFTYFFRCLLLTVVLCLTPPPFFFLNLREILGNYVGFPLVIKNSPVQFKSNLISDPNLFLPITH